MKTVIYTSILGKYDLLQNPEFINEDYDYYCITDDEETVAGTIWKPILSKNIMRDITRTNRHHKMMPHLYFPDHELSLYIDGRITIKKDLKPLIEGSLGERNIAFRIHHNRNCLYKEARHCASKRLDSPNIIRKQVGHYLSKKYPINNGLIYGGIILRRHHKPEVIALMNRWWEDLLRFSKRDQIALPYILWEKRLAFSYFDSKLLDETLHIGKHIKK